MTDKNILPANKRAYLRVGKYLYFTIRGSNAAFLNLRKAQEYPAVQAQVAESSEVLEFCIAIYEH